MSRGIVFFIIAIFCACQSAKKPSVEELFNVDKEFSAASEETGFNKAFIEFAHDDAVLLRNNNYPLVGKPQIIRLFEEASAENIDFTWEPLSGDIANSGELGYTYGIYTLKNDSLTEQGTYVSVWKKNKEGKWKYILDSGNEGLGK